MPSYEWQELPEGDAVAVPPGLEIDLPLDGLGRRRARIPPAWQLRVWIEELDGFLRTRVARDTTIAELNHAASTALGGGMRARLRFASTPPDEAHPSPMRTAEQAGLFERLADVRFDVQPAEAT